MSDFVLGNTVTELWTILDGADAPLTGVTTPAGIVFTLHRQSGATMVAASETITFAEIGVTGVYYISFTPLNTGLYVLQLHELHASSQGRWFRFPDIDMLSAGAVFTPAYTNAFCGEADIERWIQYPITATTAPSSTDAAAFAETRAAILMSLCARFGYTVTPTTVTSGTRIEDLLREGNAIGAALDYTIAQQFGKSPSATSRVEALSALWTLYYGTIKEPGYIQGEVQGNLSSLSTDYIISGDTIAAPATTVTDIGITIGMGSLF